MSLCLPDLTSDRQLIVNIAKRRIQVIYCFYMILVLVAGVLCTWHGMRILQDLGASLEKMIVKISVRFSNDNCHNY